MRLKIIVPAILAISLAIAVATVACSSGNSYSILQTQVAEDQATFAVETAVKQTEIAKTGGFDLNTLAGQVRATQAAEATYRAEHPSTPTPTAATSSTSGDTAPPGPAKSGNVTVKILSGGVMDPAVLKITVGTTVTWQNTDFQGHNTISAPGDPESWNSGVLARQLGSNQDPTYSHTFKTPGKYIYGSKALGDNTTAVIWVVPAS